LKISYFQKHLEGLMAVPPLRAELDDEPGFDPRHLRDVLGCFPTGVAIVTASDPDGAYYGVTISSFNSVSLDPPLVLFSLSRRLLSLDGILRAESFAIHFLGDDQERLSKRFATALADKWHGVEYRLGHTGCPVLIPALAVLECLPYAQYDGGDHVIVVGRVTHLEADHEKRPLVFFRGRYHTLSRPEPMI
jgi:flavin reductase (DIM6/NTAB) family NADH-FMN oxidoreductase RutF